MSIEAQFQREVNRALDADRNTRKRGLQKLFESLPWEKKSTKAELIKFIEESLLKVCINGISDEVEKCREYSLKILKSYFGLLLKKTVVTADVLLPLLRALYLRVNDSPFPEVAEELRLLVLELLSVIVQRIKPLLKDTVQEDGSIISSLAPVFNDDLDRLIMALTKVLGDNFPAVKRAAAELIIALCKSKAITTMLRTHSKSVVRSLIANATHQHSKTRSVTLQAVVSILLVLQSQESFSSLWKEFVYPALQRFLTDRTPSVRRDMVDELQRLLQARIVTLTQKQNRMLVEEDIQTVLLLLLLAGDEVEEVAVAARTSVVLVLDSWTMPKGENGDNHTAMDVDESIENAELALREQQREQNEASNAQKMVIEVVDSNLNMRGLSGFLRSAHGTQLIAMLLQNITEQWTVEGKSQSLRGSAAFFSIVFDLFHPDSTGNAMIVASDDNNKEVSTPNHPRVSMNAEECLAVYELLDAQLPMIFQCLLPLMRHDEETVRHAAESVARQVGTLYPIAAETGSAMDVWLSLLLPRVRGEISGTDTSSQRSMSIRLASHVYRGSMQGSDLEKDNVVERWLWYVQELISSLARQRSLWNQFHNDVPVKEAIILYIRTIFLQSHTMNSVGSQDNSILVKITTLPGHIQRDVAQIYLYLMSAPAVQSLALQYQQGALGHNANANSAMGGGNGDIERIARRDFLQFVQQFNVHQDETAASGATIATTGKKDEQSTQDLVTIGKVLQPHFISLFVHIVTPYLIVTDGVAPPSSSYIGSATAAAAAVEDRTQQQSPDYDALWVSILQRGSYKVQWENMSVDLLCLQTLCQFCLLETWRQWSLVVPLFAQLVDPSHGVVAPGSIKDTMISYASQRGEDTSLTQESLISYDQRMHVLILLEQLIRLGTTLGHFWEAGTFISQSTSLLMSRIFLPNLIWRVGRVEATIRKIALAGVYALMKAGAVPRDVIISIARDILPVLVNHLDDMDVSPRLMACLSLSVFFARLGPQGCMGIWDELGLKEIYPKFLARLDDSHDEVRMSACQLLASFAVSVCGKMSVPGSGSNNNAVPQRGSRLMSDTMMEYVIDQLFIHLDDMNQAMQEQVYQVLFTIATQCEGDMVYHQLNANHVPKDFAVLISKKAEQQKLSHRSPRFCEKLIAEIYASREQGHDNVD